MKHRGYLRLVGKGGERTKIKDITIDTLSDGLKETFQQQQVQVGKWWDISFGKYETTLEHLFPYGDLHLLYYISFHCYNK